ncbi:ABC transporter permease [Amorphus coralli]|uniref:ABC transporter permease n=1 Tax=Amorphus coralli TaxID=340680 RepID=UPI000368719E|nr:ABC transporter permease [Amorphus coralli]
MRAAANRLTRGTGDRRRPDALTALSGAGVIALVAVAVLAPWIAPYDPLASDAANALAPPSAAHWAGTDQVGRDVFSRLIAATRLDLAIALSAVVASLALGSVLGAVCGYRGGLLDRIVGRGVDVLLAFPLFILAIALAAALGGGAVTIVVATAVVNLPFYVRLTRAEVNARAGAGWVEAARLAGNGPGRVVFGVLLPNVMPVLAVQASLNLGWAILNAAGLSFLGVGVEPPTPEWGIMVAEGARYLTAGKWWLVAFPGLALTLAVLAFNLLGDGLRDRLDPRGHRG